MKFPSIDEFRKELQATLDYLDKVDSHSDYDHELARWQEYVFRWTSIYDENGSL